MRKISNYNSDSVFDSSIQSEMSTALVLSIAFVILGDLLLFGFLWAAAAKSQANRPANVGNGRIEKGSGKPNYVSSLPEEPEPNRIDPLIASNDPETAWAAALDAVQSLDKATVVTKTESYLHAEVRSSFFNFVDDLELQLVSEERKIHLKSASRVGYSDLGANRNRIEKVRSRFSKA